MMAESSPVLLEPTAAPRYPKLAGEVTTGPKALSQSPPCLAHHPHPAGVCAEHLPLVPEPSVKNVIRAVWSVCWTGARSY